MSERANRFDRVESLDRRSLAIKESLLGADHPDVAVTLNNLAVLCKRQGRYREASSLYQRARPGTHVDVLPSIGFTSGETFRVSFVNTSADPLLIIPCIHDPEGTIVKQQTMTLRPGQTRWLDLSRSELPARDFMRMQLRTGVILENPADAKSLMISGEIIDEVSGRTTSFISPGSAFEGWIGSHNETFVADDGI